MTKMLLLPLRRLATRVLRWHREQIVAPVGHAEIVAAVTPEAFLSRRYLFMITVSCAIATLGLLQSSPAVIIGAMLISPLMGPIMGLGFSLCIVDLYSMRRSLAALATGTALALAISALITYLSPLHEATPEILARTRPNLFDLLVAIFSGVAGAYTTIKRKGEAIVGVAIATALMPPLAVVGYGLAVGDFSIAGGAAFLFMTNLLAIALCTTVVARWYGFGARNSSAHTLFQSALVIVTFAVISVPLGFALRQIALESWLAQQVRVTLTDYFGSALLRVDTLRVRRDTVRGVDISAVALVQRWFPDARTELERRLQTRLRQRFPGKAIDVVPAPMALPLISFNLGKASPDVEGGQALELIRWALTRWQIRRVMVIGYASTPREARSFNNLELARRRAASVAAWLDNAGFQVTERADYPVDRQPLLEREQGILPFQAVRVSIDGDRSDAGPAP